MSEKNLQSKSAHVQIFAKAVVDGNLSCIGALKTQNVLANAMSNLLNCHQLVEKVLCVTLSTSLSLMSKAALKSKRYKA